MKYTVVILVAALTIAVGGDGYARPHHRHPVRHATTRSNAERTSTRT